MMQDLSIPLQRHASGSAAGAPPATGALHTAIVDEIDAALIVCGPRGELHTANAAARQELAASDSVAVRDGYLHVRGIDAQRWYAALRGAAERGRRCLLELELGTTRRTIGVGPLRTDGEALVLVTLGRESPCSAVALQLLGALHKLTPAEIAVLDGLLAGRSARAIGEERHVALSTIRTQIATMRAKMGADSIEGMLLQAARLPVGLRGRCAPLAAPSGRLPWAVAA